MEAVAEVIFRRLADGVEVLFADHGAAQRSQTKDGAHPVKGKVHVDVLFLRLHVKGGLGAVDLELAHGLEPVAQDLHHRRLELVAVEALERHLALIAHNNFTHSYLLIFCKFFMPSSKRLRNASTSSGVLSAQNDTRMAVSMASGSRPMAARVWLGWPRPQALAEET